MFKTQFDKHDRVFSNVGSRIHDVYTPEFDKNGVMNLVKTGQENIYDYIQSHADSVNIHVLLRRFRNGEADVLQRVQGVYGDFTEMPKTYAEAMNAMIKAEQYFNSLPVDVRANFGHSYAQFLASLGDVDFTKKMGLNEMPGNAGVVDPAVVAAVDGVSVDDNKA